MRKESILSYGFSSAPKYYHKSANSRRSAKRSQIEISPPNFQLRGEVPDTTVANYQLRSDTFEIRPDFFKYNGKKGTKNVSISGIDDKRSITATFFITMENKILQTQLIYKEKTSQSFPKIQFPNGFSSSANLKHYSNKMESLKFLKEIILPYVKTEQERFGLETQPALLI